MAFKRLRNDWDRNGSTSRLTHWWWWWWCYSGVSKMDTHFTKVKVPITSFRKGQYLVRRSSNFWHMGNCRRCSKWSPLTSRRTAEWQTFSEVSAGMATRDCSVSAGMAARDCSVSASVLRMLLVLFCTLNPSGDTTSKSQVELNEANVGVFNTSFLIGLPASLWNCNQYRPQHHDDNMGVPRLVSSKFPHLRTQWVPQACWGAQHH
jgi:hypothetical protein